jgi:hypothetical protein
MKGFQTFSTVILLARLDKAYDDSALSLDDSKLC